MKKSLKLPIILIVWPFLMYALWGLIAENTSVGAYPDNAEESREYTALVIAGSTTVFGGPVSIITGIVLLISRLINNSKYR